MLKEKLIKIRKEKKFSQQDIAEHLNISQSHYQRKEKGEIGITNNEWERIANLFETDVEEIKENDEATNVMNNFDNSSGNYIGNNNNYCNIPEYILENQKDYIALLKEEIERLKGENKLLKSQK
ncbi:helix-turn-helix transcriptional regulator [Chryseobacterium sp. Hurlbut01]|jgi:transcriptional regulator with XRE-family HTH domain|uniref:helix-turn-helix transcriptional regulator n=1 Tax=Chryseobacterium sp. Hurlbut01 TaxID=1681828 RepID=UPI00067CBD80|nr:helix-turn-helix transcriptional regulator [Chryseobacterium sp. Hurlbut01]KNB62981.1 helix-turn-helix domain-containing protein [Chryseobacterium sp. Hurlbut01]